jgi:hypothetical protein
MPALSTAEDAEDTEEEIVFLCVFRTDTEKRSYFLCVLRVLCGESF